MMKERIAAIVIGLIMIFSIGGFALSSIVVRTGDQQQGPQISYIVNRPLTPEEKVFVLRTGRVLIENIYLQDCVECPGRNALLESFANTFQQYVVLEEVAIGKNQTGEVFHIIGNNGEIKDLSDIELTQETLFNMFCEIAIVQPRECLLREI